MIGPSIWLRMASQGLHGCRTCHAHERLAYSLMLQPPDANPCLGPGAGKQPSSPSRQGQSPHARLQAARSFFAPSRTAGCKAGHPQAVLQGLVQALHQLPADLNQGKHWGTEQQLMPSTLSVCVPSATTVCLTRSTAITDLSTDSASHI